MAENMGFEGATSRRIEVDPQRRAETRALLEQARPKMPWEVAAQLTSIWHESNPSRRFETLSTSVEHLMIRLCELMNSIHWQRARSSSRSAERPEIEPIEKLLRAAEGKVSFGTYVGNAREIARLLGATDAEAREVAELNRCSLPIYGPALLRALRSANQGRSEFFIPVKGIQSYVQQQLGSPSGKKSLFEVLDAFVTMRNAAAHNHAWWSKDDEWYHFILDYALPAFEELLAAPPVFGILTNYETVEVDRYATIKAVSGATEVAPVRRNSVRPEYLPADPSRLIVMGGAQVDLDQPLGYQVRRSADDLRTLYYIGPNLKYPTPISSQAALLEQYRDRLIRQVLAKGVPDLNALKEFAASNTLSNVHEVEFKAWQALQSVLWEDPNGSAREIVVRGLGLAAQDATQERTDAALQAARDRIVEQVYELVNTKPGQTKELCKRSGLHEVLLELALKELKEQKRVISWTDGSEESFRPRNIGSQETFDAVAGWVEVQLASRQLDAMTVMAKLIELLDVTATLLVETRQAEPKEKERVGWIRGRYGDFVVSNRQTDGGRTGDLVEESDADPSAPLVTIEGKVFRVEYTVPFLRAFFEAFGASDGAFQRAIARRPVLVGRTRYLANLKPEHYNGTKFGYEVSCGEGAATVYFEGNTSRGKMLFALARYLREECRFTVTLSDATTDGASAPLTSAGALLAAGVGVDDEGKRFTGYLEHLATATEVTIEGAAPGLGPFLMAYLQALIDNEWISKEQTSYQVSNTRYLFAETPFHPDERPFVAPIEVADYVIEVNWAESDAFDALRRCSEALGLVFERETGESAEVVTESVLSRCWKIAPETEGFAWDDWRNLGIASIGWAKLGDLSAVDTEAAFEERALAAGYGVKPGEGVWQVWRFKNIREQDTIVANLGTHTVLGIGRVRRVYHYVEGATVGQVTAKRSPDAHPHRLEVEWYDVRPRKVLEPGWRRTLNELTQIQFAKVEQTPPSDSQPWSYVARAEGKMDGKSSSLTASARQSILDSLIYSSGCAAKEVCDAHFINRMRDRHTPKAAHDGFENAAWDLRRRGCMYSTSPGVWVITDAGRRHAAGGPLPPVLPKALESSSPPDESETGALGSGVDFSAAVPLTADLPVDGNTSIENDAPTHP